MLSILYNEYKEWGCPNCGCDSATSGCFSGGGVTTGTCRHCKLTFEIRSDNGIGTVRYGSHPENPSDPKSEYVMEYARRIPHPRSGIPAWHWEPKDVRPDELLDSLDNKFVRLQMVDPAAAKITLSKIEEDECGATYLCKSKNYNDRVWICAVTLSVFGEYPQNIYLKDM